MNDRYDFSHPDYEPGEFDAVERDLRQALREETDRVRPGDRLEQILAIGAAQQPVPLSSPARRWVIPLAAAAAAAVVATTTYAVTRADDRQVTPPAATTSAPTTPGPSLSPSLSPSPSPSPSQSGPTTSPGQTGPTGTPSGTVVPPPTSISVSLPVYFVGPVGDAQGTQKLYREFAPWTLGTDTVQARATAAVGLSLGSAGLGGATSPRPWAGTDSVRTTVSDQAITVTLSTAGASGLTAEQARLAVQQLVWTAQAAVGRGTIPVRFVVADGSTQLLGRFPTSAAYNRPASPDLYYQDLAPLWITSPDRDQVLPSGRAVTVTGEATVFEATVSWELRRGSSKVRTGNTMASIGAPSRGTYSIPLGQLAAGSYTVRVWEASAKDGSVAAERSVTFSVK